VHNKMNTWLEVSTRVQILHLK